MNLVHELKKKQWALEVVVDKHPDRLRPHLKQALRELDKPDQSDAFKRNTMKLFSFIEIPKSLRGLAFDKAFGLFSDTSEPIAVRVFAMTVMKQVAMDEPELKNEVIIAIEEHLPYGSAGFLSRARRLLKELKGERKDGTYLQKL